MPEEEEEEGRRRRRRGNKTIYFHPTSINYNDSLRRNI